jgi:ATP-dependent Zn protease
MSDKGTKTPPKKQRSANNKKPRKDDNSQWARPARTLAFWAIILLISIWVTTKTVRQEQAQARPVTYSQFQELLKQKKIKSAEIKGTKLEAELSDPVLDSKGNATRIRTTLPEKPSFTTIEGWDKLYDEAGSKLSITFKDEAQDWWNYLLGLLPWIAQVFLAVSFAPHARRRQQGHFLFRALARQNDDGKSAEGDV